MIALKGKGFGLGKFKNCTDFDIPSDNIWYSIDADSYNFHIVPDESVEINNRKQLLHEWLKDKRKEIIGILNKEIGNQVKPKTNYADHFKPSWTKNHMWVEAIDNKYFYLLVFGRLWHRDNIVNNNFGELQFMRYPKTDTHINMFDFGKINRSGNPIYEFQMMYPTFNGCDEQPEAFFKKCLSERVTNGHLVYNPAKFTKGKKRESLLITDDSQVIANVFKEFILESQKFKEPKEEL